MPPKVATRSSLEQIIVLDTMLRLSKPVKMSRLTSALDCCEKTVRRHLAWMKKKLGVRVVRQGQGLKYAEGQPPLFSDHLRRVVGY
jgi:hypothetical protein